MHPHRPFRRRAAVLLAWSVALGAATTLLVAWALAAALPYREMAYASALLVSKREGESRLFGYERISRRGMERQAWSRSGDGDAPSFGRDITQTLDGHLAYDTQLSLGKSAEIEPTWGEALRVYRGGQDASSGIEDARGWPMLALCYQIRPAIANTGPNVGGVVPRAVGGIALFDPDDAWLNGSELRALPLRPLWPGFLADSGVYASAWVLILVVPRFARSRRWRRAGRCPSCGYDLRGMLDGPCPECGSGGRESARDARRS